MSQASSENICSHLICFNFRLLEKVWFVMVAMTALFKGHVYMLRIETTNGLENSTIYLLVLRIKRFIEKWFMLSKNLNNFGR
jgi:hypothetical protein